MKKTICIIGLCLLFSSLSFSRQMGTAGDINQRLGRGINMGSTFEAPSEDGWNNPWKPEYFKIMADMGFSHVRVPICWELDYRSMNEPPYTIYPVFFERIKTVVNEALKNKLHVVINMHHHEKLLKDPLEQKERFLSQWKQISDYFKNYPDSLVFEILNEPNGKLTPEIWNTFASEALSIMRETNPDRTIMIASADNSIDGLAKLQLPKDNNLILTVHYYNPFYFTHQGVSWGNTVPPVGVKWNDTEKEREAIFSDFELVEKFSKEHNIPIHIGEFGAYEKADMDSRARWATFLSRFFDERGYSWAYWEFSSSFGIYNPRDKTFYKPLANALLHSPMPEPMK